MKQTMNLHDFREAFRRMDRGDQFSYAGLAVLFEYLGEYEDATGEQIELDVIALCCDYSEGTPEDIAQDYGIELDEDDTADMDEDERDEALEAAVLDYLNENTSVCGQTGAGTIVYCQSF